MSDGKLMLFAYSKLSPSFFLTRMAGRVFHAGRFWMQNEMQRWGFASAGLLQADGLRRAAGLIFLVSDLPSADCV